LAPTVRALAPRFAGAVLYYLSSFGTSDGLWRYRDGQAFEIWRGADGALLETPNVSPNGSRVAIVWRRSGKRRLHVLPADGAELQPIADTINVQPISHHQIVEALVETLRHQISFSFRTAQNANFKQPTEGRGEG
jgi:hypothetical protein